MMHHWSTTPRSLGFVDTNWFVSNYHILNILRCTIVPIEDSVYQGTIYVVYAYGSTKDLLPPEAQNVLSLSEERVVKILRPVGTAFQQDRSKVIVMDAYGTRSKGIARFGIRHFSVSLLVVGFHDKGPQLYQVFTRELADWFHQSYGSFGSSVHIWCAGAHGSIITDSSVLFPHQWNWGTFMRMKADWLHNSASLFES
ncbi:hypothetical protein TEA_022536 [Camellia sinensis var. sinensis]|uniref:Uncharacterized protein n=1 Tax=Camellia sinensis var. sinensis TaxID=542762 RepID=A0A4S4DWE3_CAMSN|nr:hypothetical protein TEA_022536 [Camellia sinensis var. sinensis]